MGELGDLAVFDADIDPAPRSGSVITCLPVPPVRRVCNRFCVAARLMSAADVASRAIAETMKNITVREKMTWIDTTISPPARISP